MTKQYNLVTDTVLQKECFMFPKPESTIAMKFPIGYFCGSIIWELN